MNPAFNILTPGVSYAQSSLLLKINEQGISFIIINDQNCCDALVIYPFERKLPQDEIANALKNIVAAQSVLQQTFKKINVLFGFSQSVMVPEVFGNEALNSRQLNLLYGEDTDGIIATDIVATEMIHHVYRVSKSMDWMTTQLFPSAHKNHWYSYLPQLVAGSGHLLYCTFDNSGFTVLLQKEGKLQLVQYFYFDTAEDIVYHLLNICQRFEVNIHDAVLHLNGMIDVTDTNYTELYKYFSEPIFGELPQFFNYNDEIKKYPAHYFSHLFELAACV